MGAKKIKDEIILNNEAPHIEGPQQRPILSLVKEDSAQVIDNPMQISQGNLKIDTTSFQAYINDQSIKLTPLEFKLTRFFCETDGQMFSRSELLTYVWGETHVLKRTVDSTIASLRKKTKLWDFKIRSVYGVGYQLTEKKKN